MITATVTSRQSLFDIAIQHCGNMETAFDIALLNGIGLTDDLQTSEELELVPPADNGIVQTFTVNHYKPATGITTTEILDILGQDEGIEFWTIETDFIIG